MTEKDYEEDDPFELVGTRLTGPEANDALDEMARVFIVEFVRMGWTRERILAVFRNPFYRGPYEVYRHRGEAHVRRLLEEVS